MDHHAPPSGYQYPAPQPGTVSSPPTAQQAAPPAAPEATPPTTYQTYQYGYGSNYNQATETSHAPAQNQGHYYQPPQGSHSSTPNPASPAPGPSQASPSPASGHAAYGQNTQPWQQSWDPSNNPQHHQQQQQQQQMFQQRPSFPSFSGKKTSSWLKKNVAPRFNDVAKSSLVQGSIKELGNAYTAAKGMKDNYSAKYYASQAASIQNAQGSQAPPAGQQAPTWDPAQPQHNQPPNASYNPPPVTSPPASTGSWAQTLYPPTPQQAPATSPPPAGQSAPGGDQAQSSAHFQAPTTYTYGYGPQTTSSAQASVSVPAWNSVPAQPAGQPSTASYGTPANNPPVEVLPPPAWAQHQSQLYSQPPPTTHTAPVSSPPPVTHSAPTWEQPTQAHGQPVQQPQGVPAVSPPAVATKPISRKPIGPPPPAVTEALAAAPVNTAPANTASVNPVPVDAAPVNPLLVNQSAVYQPPLHQEAVRQESFHQTPIHQTPVSQAPLNPEPLNYQAPVSQQPVHLQSVHRDSFHQAPTHQHPVYQAPIHQEPVRQESFPPTPFHQQPVRQGLPNPEPVSYQAPVYQAPVQQEPIYQPPIHQEPVYQQQVHQQPVQQQPVHQEPVYRAPMNDAPVSHAPPANQEPSPATREDASKGRILSIDYERNKAIRVVPGPNGDDNYVLEDYPPKPVSAEPVAGNPEPTPAPAPADVHQQTFQAYSPPPQTYQAPPVADQNPVYYQDPVPQPLFGGSYAPEPARDPYSGYAPAATQAPEVPAKPDFMSKIISAISQVQLSGPVGALAAPMYNRAQENLDPAYEPHAMTTPVTATAAPNAPYRVCPQARTVRYSTTWHYLKGLPDFGICRWCFDTYIQPTSLAHEFDSVVKPTGLCRFNVPRVTKSLVPEAQRTSDIGPLRDYISRRLSIPACTKKAGAIGNDKVKWFGLVAGELGMVACEACHEDEVLATSFASRFGPLQQVQGATERWTCTISYSYVSTALKVLSKRGDRDTAWGEFVEAARTRMNLLECDGSSDTASRRNWYRPKQKVGDIDFCEACYLDTFAMTPFAEHFAETGETWEQKLYMRMCDLSLMPMAEAAYVCRLRGLSINVFLRAAAKISASPRCFRKIGIQDGKFYNFAGSPAGNFGICEACHAGILTVHGVDKFFAPEPQLVQGSAFCAFNPSVERFQGYVDHWQQSSETGAWDAYETWTRKYATLPTCPNFNMAANRKWYGWDDCPICPECYETVAEGTSLVPSMELRDTLVAEERLCSVYSERMRAKYREACEAGNAELLRACNRHRMEIYQNTVPRFKMLAEMQSMQQMLAMSSMMLSMSYQHANAMSDWVTPSAYEYGNSSTGYHSSQYGVDSAKAWDEGQAQMARANGPVAEASYLKDIWQAVE